jgi:AbrB family looped-hinge helix DNA binding protein
MPKKIRVGAGGRIVIPRDIRLKHKIEEGATLEISEANEGLLLRPCTPLTEMKGLGKEVVGDPIGYQRKMRDEWERSE